MLLVLFDIDQTMISTGGAGMRAMQAAGAELFGERFCSEGISYSGRLDPLIIGDMLRLSGVDDSVAVRAAFRAAYAKRLAEVLEAERGKGRVLPGVRELITSLEELEGITLGVLTGNFRETGEMKLRACGLDAGVFEVHAWGDEAPGRPPRRDELVPVAITRCEHVRGERLTGSRVVVIGDTEHDVACAKAHGCRSVAVATGRTGIEELRAAGADLAVQDLSATDILLRWLRAKA